MEYFKKILRFAKPYKTYGYLNIFFNILYALFSALSFAALIPMLNELFDQAKPRLTPPVYDGIGKVKVYVMDYMNYHVTQYSDGDKMKGLGLGNRACFGAFFVQEHFQLPRHVLYHLS